MKIKDYKCKCGHNDFFFANKGNQKGVYCSYCGKWFKWADKDEQNLSMKQEPVLDKIRTEIEEYRDSMRWNSESLVKWEAINYVLEHIIDKYKAESEDK